MKSPHRYMDICIETIVSTGIAMAFPGFVWYLKLLKNSFWCDAGHSTTAFVALSKIVYTQKKPLEEKNHNNNNKNESNHSGTTGNCALN